jgi:hypothetical protein
LFAGGSRFASAADKRLVPLTYEGVEVRRIRADDLETDAAADAVVKELIEFMARRKDSGSAIDVSGRPRE